MLTLPPFWEILLKKYVKRTFYAGTRKKDFALRGDFTEGDYRFFADGVRRLNVAFTQERHALPGNYLNRKEYRSGYLLYFLPVNALKTAALLEQLPRDFFLRPEGGTLRVLDIGSGPGTGMMGVMLHLENLSISPRLHWTLVDQNKDALNDARYLHDALVSRLREAHPGWAVESHLRVVSANLFSEKLTRTLPPQPFDLILALNFLSELPRQKRLPTLDMLLRDYLNPGGRILIMEPALRETTRGLMRLHDEILARKLGFVHAPCLHQAACPMLAANDRDWCHTYIPWERPPWIEKIDRLVGIRKDYLKCAYLILGREPPPATDSQTWRVVSGPLNSKGKSERLLCGPGGLPHLLRVIRLDRDRSGANADFEKLERGDVVQLPKVERIRPETPVRKMGGGVG